MNERFQVGEIAIIRASVHCEFIGRECEIVKPLAERTTSCGDRRLSYVIRIPGTQHLNPKGRDTWNAAPYCLRKKYQPPDFTAGEWDLIPWQPKKVRA